MHLNSRNCWEVKNCGRQPGGDQVVTLGECPAVSAFACHRVNNGINGGRACWAVAGTLCGGKVQGSFTDKVRGCANCDFFHQVSQEEGRTLVPVTEILNLMKG